MKRMNIFNAGKTTASPWSCQCNSLFNRQIISSLMLVLLFCALDNLSAAQDPHVATAEESKPVARKIVEATDSDLLDRITIAEPMWIVMHARSPAARLAMQLDAVLSSFGINNVEVRYVESVPDLAQVRFYHQADGEAGQVLADVMSLVFDNVPARSFVDYQPAPARGLIEVWIP